MRSCKTERNDLVKEKIRNNREMSKKCAAMWQYYTVVVSSLSHTLDKIIFEPFPMGEI